MARNPDNPLYTLHSNWTSPTPWGGDDLAPIGGPYFVDPEAPMYPGDVLIRMGQIEAVTSGTLRSPVCSDIKAFRPSQPTRIVIAMIEGIPSTRPVWNHEVATMTLTATLNAGGGITVPLTPVKTELNPTVFLSECRPFFLR